MTLYRITAEIRHGDHYRSIAIEADGPRDLVTRLFVQSTYFPLATEGWMREEKAQRIWTDLMNHGRAFHGWVEFTAEEIPTPEASGPRTYALGIPVAITVHPDGRVTFDFDLAELPLDESDAEPRYDDDTIAEDQGVIDTLTEAIRYNVSLTL